MVGKGALVLVVTFDSPASEHTTLLQGDPQFKSSLGYINLQAAVKGKYRVSSRKQQQIDLRFHAGFEEITPGIPQCLLFFQIKYKIWTLSHPVSLMTMGTTIDQTWDSWCDEF